MTSPGLAPLNLTLHSINEEDLVAAMVAAVATRIPGWTPVEATIEAALMEAWAIAAGQSVYTLNQLPTVVIDALLQMNGLLRHTATPAVGVLAVTMATGTTGVKVVPAGTTFRVSPDAADSFDVVSVGTISASPTDGLTFAVPVTGIVAGTGPNGIGPGTVTSLVDSLSWVESVNILTAMAGGTDGEDDEPFHQRGAAYLQSRNSTLVVPSNFAVAALDVDGVGRAWAFNNWNGTTGNPGDQPGHITVVVATPGGAPCASGVKTTIGATLTANALASLTIHVIDPLFVAAVVTANISVIPGYDATEVRGRVVAAITSFLDPANRELGATLPANLVVGLIARVDGVSIVNSVGGSAVGHTPTRLDLPALSPTVTVTVT